MLPHNLLPIVRPLEDTTQYDETYFYDNVVKALIPDIVQMEANGIPIDLKKVAKLETTVDDVLGEVHKKLANNDMMLNFLKSVTTQYKKDKTKELENKKKEPEDFLKPFNIKNTTHRTFVVNTYLTSNGKDDMVMEKWGIRDLKKLNQILASKFISDLLDGDIQDYMQTCINTAMYSLAQTKSEIYNENKIDSKINQLQEQDLIHSFNPGSSIQKQNFFKFYGIESEKETKAGNPQWDRTELLRLQKLLETMIDEKGDSHESES